MEYIEKMIEMRTIKRSEVLSYFISINGEDMGQGRIVGQGWEVEVSEEKSINLGSLTIPAIEVVLRCKKELFEQFYSEFRLKFLRGGG